MTKVVITPDDLNYDWFNTSLNKLNLEQDAYFINTFQNITNKNIPLTVNKIRTGAYVAIGDDGGAYYDRLSVAPSPIKPWHKQSLDGSWWVLSENEVYVEQFGALGNNTANDSVAIQTAIDYMNLKGGGFVILKAKSYKVKAVNLKKYVFLQGVGDASVLANFDTTDLTNANTILNVIDDYATLIDVKIKGVVYADYASSFTASVVNITPVRSLNVEKTGGIITGVNIARVRVEGGQQACWVSQSKDLNVNNLDIFKPFQWGFSLNNANGGHEGFMINNIRARGCGINEGVKLSSTQAGIAMRRGFINNVLIEDCGVLNSDTSQQQNGFDCFAAVAQDVTISNVTIRGCGGGFEVKRNNQPSTVLNAYENFIITNVNVEIDKEGATGLTVLMTSPSPTIANTGRGIKIVNFKSRWTGAVASTLSYGALIQAWTDVEFINFTSEGAFLSSMYLSGAGSSDNTIRRFKAYNPILRGASRGITIGGVIDDVLISNAQIDATDYALFALSSSTGDGLKLIGGNYKASSDTNSRPAVYVNSAYTNTLIDGADIAFNGTGTSNYGLRLNGSGVVKNTKISSSTSEAIRVDGANFAIYKNELYPAATKRSILLAGGAIGATNTSMNMRGFAINIPTLAAAVGDIYLNSAPTLTNEGWRCYTAGNDGASVWASF